MKALELAETMERSWPVSRHIHDKAAAELRRLAAVEVELERIKALEPVATVMAHPTPSVSYSIRAIHGIPHGTKLYALGSKT